MHAFVFRLASPTGPASRTGRVGRFALVAVMAAVLGACSLSPWRTEGNARSGAEATSGSLTGDYPRSTVVALDFVTAMAALPDFDPAFTTLFTDRPDSRFGEIFVSALQSAGYDLRLGRGDGGLRLDYTVSSQAAALAVGANRYTFQVSAGMLRLKRSYEVDVAGVRPTGEMLMHGSAAVGAISQTAQTTPLRRRREQPLEPLDASWKSRVAAVNAAAADATASAAITLTKLPAAPAAAAPTARRKTTSKRNLHASGLSNYADFLAGYDTLRRDIMVFPNDSLFMGSDNKQLAQRIVDDFDADRDVLSLIGCSHGRTALDNGNELLANGRSDRVKEEFTLAGIDADLVLDEGCWASRSYDRMPARGVVVTHKRRTRG